MPPRKVYLDTTILSRLVNLEQGLHFPSRRLEEDMAVLPRLLHMCRDRDVGLCTSEDARVEIERLATQRPDVRDALLAQFLRFRQVPARHSVSVQAAGLPLDSLIAEIESFLLQKTQATNRRKVERLRWDARHVAVAWDGGCDVFLTTDYASLWAFRRGLKERFGLRVTRPVELWRELGGVSPLPLGEG